MESSEVYNLLKDHGIRPSRQRVLIFQDLYRNKDFPTAEDIFLRLKNEIRSLSKTTVYNTMKLFEEHGLVRFIPTKGNENKYTLIEDNMAYFYCINCDSVQSVKLKTIPEMEEDPNLEVRDAVIIFKGKCKNCN